MKGETIGIIGAGKLSVVVAQLALKAGYEVAIAGSGSPDKIALSMQVLAPGAKVMTSEEVVRSSDVVLLALPLGKYKELPQKALDGKLVIDATNHWWEVDGLRDEIIDPDVSSSEAMQSFLAGARVVKALNHMGYHDLHDEPRPAGASGRKAIAIAGDNEEDVVTVATIIDRLGFDPLPIGRLAKGCLLEPGGPVFGANVDKVQLGKQLTRTPDR